MNDLPLPSMRSDNAMSPEPRRHGLLAEEIWMRLPPGIITAEMACMDVNITS